MPLYSIIWSRDLPPIGRQIGMWTVKRSGWQFDRCHVVFVLVGLLFLLTALDGGAPDGQSPTALHRENESATPSVSPTPLELPSCYVFDSGCKLMVSTVLEAPYMMLKPEGAFLTGNDRFEGYLADILRQLSSSIGFKYEIRLSRGVKHDDDVYLDRFLNGVISEVRRGHAQIGAGPLVVSNRTMDFVDFTHPFLSLRSSALLRRKHPPPSVPHHRPSSPASSTPLPAPHRHQPNNHHQHHQHQHQQQDEDVITDSSQLLQSNLTYGVIHSGVAYHMFAGSREPVTRAMWSRMTTLWPRAFVHSVQEGVERARRGGYAFIIDTPTAEYAAGRPPCDLYTTEPFLDVMSYGFVMRKADFELRHVIDRELRRMKWSDEMQTMFLRWWRSECIIVKFASSSSSSSSHHLPHQRSKETAMLPTKEQKDVAAGDAAKHGYVVRVSNFALRTTSSIMLLLLCSCIFISTAAAATR